MSIALNFRARMDVALASADATRGQGDDARRAALSIAYRDAGLILTDVAQLCALVDAAKGKPGVVLLPEGVSDGTLAVTRIALDEARAALRGAIAVLGDVANLAHALLMLDDAAGEPWSDIAELAAIGAGVAS